jgi:hypothetical protein
MRPSVYSPIVSAISVLATPILIMTALAAPASAAWKEYPYPGLGVVKEFPADPKVETTTYKSLVVGDPVPAHVATVAGDTVTYTMMVADLMDRAERGASIMGECVALAELEGKPVANMPARIEGGIKAVFGRIVSVDLKNGNRAMTECFFTAGRLYKVEAIITPANDDFPNSSEAVRFINTLRFNLGNTDAGP